MKRKEWPGLFTLSVIAVTARLALWVAYRPQGVEPDGLGMALLFWDPLSLQQSLPLWWRELMPKIGGYWPPMYALLTGMLGRLLDDPFIAGRIVSSLAAAPLAIFVGMFVRRITETDRAGVFAGLIAALAPLSLAWDVRVRPETLFLAGYVAAVYFAYVYLQKRRRADLLLATGLGGAAALVKYEIVVFIPVLAYLWWLHLRDRRWRDLPMGALVAQGWVLALVWLFNNEGARVGDYRNLFDSVTLVQLPQWFVMTCLALPVVVTLPIAVLAALGAYHLGSQRTKRPVLWLLLYLIVGHLATIAVGYNWTSRYLLAVVPWVTVLAGVGFATLPTLRGLRPVVAGIALIYCLLTANVWVQAEKDRWRETIEIGQAVIKQVPDQARIWSDDPYVTPYWSGRDLLTLNETSQPQPGDYVVLHDFFGALRNKRTVSDSLNLLEKDRKIEILADITEYHHPLSGEVVSPAVLAAKQDLRALGPQTFWDRERPIAVRSVLARIE